VAARAQAARALEHADSTNLRQARQLARRLGLRDSSIVRARAGGQPRGAITIGAGRDTLDYGTAGSSADSSGVTGQTLVHGISFDDGGWSKDDFVLVARVTFHDTVAGMYRNARENPFNLIPIAVLSGLVLLLLPVAWFNAALVRALGRSIVQPVGALQLGTQALGESRLDYRIPIAGEDELWTAAGAFNRMAEGLEHARGLEKERDRLETELDLARRIQRRLLPSGPPRVAGLEIAGVSEPAREVGGDYYDHIPLGDGRVLLVIADVSGKGVPAALLMSAFRASLMSQDAEHTGPAQVARRLNAFLHRSVEPGRFVTALVGFLDGACGRFVYANAGHNPPALVRRGGEVEWLAQGGLILGILADSPFESGEVTLEPGDLLALYTDGVTEGADAGAEMFGEDRLVEALRRRAGLPCAEIAHEVVREVRAFEGEQGPADDITLLVARRA
jgi:sigma-B regulation protein RsbU (phosphoserine phosphatase)